VVELWDLFKQLGIERKKPFIDHYTQMERKDLLALAKMDRELNQGRIFKSWRKARHPQIGEVELGGFDPRVGIWNPPYEKLAQTCCQQSAAFLRVAALLPQVAVEVVKKEKVGVDQTRVELRVANRGYLGTYGLSSARKLPHAEPLRVALACHGVDLLAPAEAIVDIGQLDGWGQGLHGGPSIFMPWTRGNAHERIVTLVTRGRGKLVLTVGSCRVGQQTIEVEVA
jgi:hypothetical protein